MAIEETGDVRPVQGPTVGDVCCQITGSDKINSTISHHLKELRLAGLITMERRGKNMICGINHEAVALLVAFLNDVPTSKPASATLPVGVEQKPGEANEAKNYDCCM